jgi:hypothetical protein
VNSSNTLAKFSMDFLIRSVCREGMMQKLKDLHYLK